MYAALYRLRLKELWDGWFFGNQHLGVPPYSKILHGDTNYSKAKTIMAKLLSIAGSENLLPVTEANYNDVYKRVIEVFAVTCTFKTPIKFEHMTCNTIYNNWSSKN